MADYQVLARKYRPQLFSEVLGQDAIVTTLKNAIKRHSLAHAYLFCGSRGTGKTTLARVFAKALNCQNPSSDFEPCNQCSCCKEITSGHSLDVLEIDGASHRGIDDIRQINETVGYATASGKYKIYIIDEVHMLTKEAFNALLKTLEEPPPKVLFFFATTEPHKVLPTILSRCQRFNLNRIPLSQILDKLRRITNDLGLSVQEEALYLIANRAEGGLRDAESLLDQIIAFHEGEITAETVALVLGVMSRDSLFELDRAGKEGKLSMAFEIANQIFSEGKDVIHFIESLTEHFRQILIVKLCGKNAPFLSLSEGQRNKYEATAQLYQQEQCLNILDILIEVQQQIRFSPSAKIILEATLLRILRSHQRIPIDFLVRRLAELEQTIEASDNSAPGPNATKENKSNDTLKNYAEVKPSSVSSSPPIKKASLPSSLTEDPSPSKTDLGSKEKDSPLSAPPSTATKADKKPETVVSKPLNAPPKVESMPTEESRQEALKKQSRYDTLLQFAAIELEGTIQKKQFNR